MDPYDDRYSDVDMDLDSEGTSPPDTAPSLLSRLQPQKQKQDLLSRIQAGNQRNDREEEEDDAMRRTLERYIDTPLGMDPDVYHSGNGSGKSSKDAAGSGLKGRLGKAKVYLLEGSGAIVHHPDIEEDEVSHVG